MKSKLKLGLMSLATSLSLSLTAQTPLENLFRVERSWGGEATLILEGNTFNFTYYADFKKNNESSGMYMEEWFSHPDLGSLKGYNLIGYNARDEKIHWFSVDNFGTCHDHLGYWKTNAHFVMEATEQRQGKKYEEKIDLIFINDNEMSLHLVATIGGKLFEDVVVIFYRQGVSSGKASGEKGNNITKESSTTLRETNGPSACKVFPNPANDQITFQLPSDVAVQDLKLSIFNAAGEKVKNDLLQPVVTKVAVKGFKPGMYFYRIIGKEQILYTGKFIVQ